jgi:hypothetical protein
VKDTNSQITNSDRGHVITQQFFLSKSFRQFRADRCLFHEVVLSEALIKAAMLCCTSLGMNVSAARQWEVEYLFLEDWPRNLRKEKKNSQASRDTVGNGGC